MNSKPWLKTADRGQDSAVVTCRALPSPRLGAVAGAATVTAHRPQCEPFPWGVHVPHQMPRHTPGLLPRNNTSHLWMAEWLCVVYKVL